MVKNMKEKQKSVEREAFTPTGDSHLRRSVTLSLNREETLSEQSLKTPSNNPHVDLLSPVGGHKADMPVFILNDDGKPLIPCKPAKARHLLSDKKAKVISSNPFTIQLLWHCE